MNELAGAWWLTSAKFVFDDGETVELYGPDPRGRLLFTADGWMTAVITAGPAAGAESSQPPMVVAYSGRYRTEEGRFITMIDVSSMPPWIGTEQARNFELSGATMSIALPMPMHPGYPGRQGRGTLHWERQ